MPVPIVWLLLWTGPHKGEVLPTPVAFISEADCLEEANDRNKSDDATGRYWCRGTVPLYHIPNDGQNELGYWIRPITEWPK